LHEILTIVSGDILFGLLFSRSCPCALLNTIITESVLTKIYILSNTIKNRPREAKGSEKTEVRSQRAEVRRQRSEDRKQKTEDRSQKAGRLDGSLNIYTSKHLTF